MGQKLELTTNIKGIPSPDVTWLKDGKPITDTKGFSCHVEGETFSLIQDNVTINEDGAYTARASNVNGSVETTSKVVVLQPPLIQRELCDTDLVEGETITLEVPISGKPIPTASWYKDSVELKNNDRINLTLRETVASLEIKKASCADSGNYTVVATNSVGEAKSSSVLNILVPPTLTEISDQSVLLGKDFDFQCKIVGVPKPKITWSKNGIDLLQNECTQMTENEALGVLKKKNTNLDDEGTYTIKAENKAGTVTQKAIVTVLIPPSFSSPLNDQTLLENEDLDFALTVLGKPPPALSWIKDGNELKSDKRTKIVQEKDRISLSLKKVTQSDSGKYKCIAKNEVGEVETEAAVIVNSKPQVIKKLKDLVINEGEVLILEAQFKGYPDPEVKWYRDDELLPEEFSRKEDGCHLLTLENIKVENSGAYSAVAQNSVGECKTSAKVKVIREPYFEKPLSDMTIVEKQLLKLIVEVGGCPEPEVEWAKDGKTFGGKKSGPEKVTIKKEKNVHFLSIPKVSIEDQGTYTILAKNQAGEVKGQASVVVQGIVLSFPIIFFSFSGFFFSIFLSDEKHIAELRSI